MKKIGIFGAIGVFCCACGTAADEESLAGAEQAEELSGGYVDTRNVFSSVVQIAMGGSCTATRVSNDTFLTAAHCVVGKTPGSLLDAEQRQDPGEQGAWWTASLQRGGLLAWVPFPLGRVSDTPTRANALTVVATWVHPTCSYSVGPGCIDLAFIRVQSIPNSTMYSRISGRKAYVGQPVAIVGAGREPDYAGNIDPGLRRRKFAYTSLINSPDGRVDRLYTAGIPWHQSASVAQGDSGGPLFDAQGALIGVHETAWTRNGARDSTWASHVELSAPAALAWLRMYLPAYSFAE